MRDDWIEEAFALPTGGPSKVTTLDDAIERFVEPGDTIHLGLTHTRGSAAFWELLRRFRGTDPGFTFAAVATSSPFAPLVHARLARTLITSWAGDSYWTPGPNGVYQRAWADGSVTFEQWSILTFAQRLAAGARGLRSTTTRSLIGSAMENNPGVQRLDDETLLIPALVPDVSIFHAPAADASGNVLFSPPLMEDVWGALAASRGCIVTVERIVDPDFIRAHAHMTRIPSSSVLAVIEVPFGAHPGGLLPTGIQDIASYDEDYAFWADIRTAAKDPVAMDAWIDEWITPGQDAYRDHVRPRIDVLRVPPPPTYDDVDATAPPTDVEWAVVAAARVLAEQIRTAGHTAMLAGAGMANLAAWVAAYQLAREGTHVDLVAEMGLVGYWPRPGEPILFNQRNFPTCTMLTDIDKTLGVIIGGGRARSIGALGAAQVDRFGNINSTELPGEYLLMGSGGANDVITCATESLVICSQRADRFVEQVPYVTGPGARVTRVVSTQGIYAKVDGELVLTGVLGVEPADVAKNCGWSLVVADTVEQVAPPTEHELLMVRAMDPRGWFRA